MNIINGSVTLLSRLCDCYSPTTPIINWKSDKPPLIPSPVSSPLPRALPEEKGVPSSLIARFINDLAADPTLNMHTLLFVKDGCVIASAEFGEYDLLTPKYVFSASKSVTALAVGMLMDEGGLTLEERMADIFPEKVSTLSKLRLRDVTVETLLTMRSGITFAELSSMISPDWQDSFLSSSTRGSVGKDFFYNSLNTYMLAAIIKKKTGCTLVEFLTPRLFAPLDIKNFYWEKSPEGIEKGGWGLYIRPEDFAKIGVMVQNGGVWNGRRIISSTWLKSALEPHAAPPGECGDFNYGYQIWCGRKSNTFLFNGMLGQNLLCFRKSGLIIVSNAGNDESFQQSNYFKYVQEAFDKPFSLPLNPDASGAAELERAIYAAKHPAEAASQKRRRGPFARIFGKKGKSVMDDFDGLTARADDAAAASASLLPVMLQAIENNYSPGFDRMTVTKAQNDEYTIIFDEKSERHEIAAGQNKFIRTTVDFRGQSFLVAASVKGGVDEDGHSVLTLDVLFLETPFSRRIKLVLDKAPYMIFSERPGSGFSERTVNDIMRDLSKTPLIGSLAELVTPGMYHGLILSTFEKRISVKAVRD